MSNGSENPFDLGRIFEDLRAQQEQAMFDAWNLEDGEKTGEVITKVRNHLVAQGYDPDVALQTATLVAQHHYWTFNNVLLVQTLLSAVGR